MNYIFAASRSAAAAPLMNGATLRPTPKLAPLWYKVDALLMRKQAGALPEAA